MCRSVLTTGVSGFQARPAAATSPGSENTPWPRPPSALQSATIIPAPICQHSTIPSVNRPQSDLQSATIIPAPICQHSTIPPVNRPPSALQSATIIPAPICQHDNIPSSIYRHTGIHPSKHHTTRQQTAIQSPLCRRNARAAVNMLLIPR